MYSYLKKIYSCIDQKDKKYVIPIILLILFNTLVELVGIGAFIPLINLILSPESYDTNKFLIFLSNKIFLSNFNISYILIFLIVSFFLFRFFFQSFYFLIIQKFLHNVSLGLSSNLLNIYMRQPIQISLQSKPSVMLKNLNTEINILKSQIFLMVKFASDLVLAFSIISILIYFDPKITIYAIFFLVGFFLLYLFFSKNYLLSLGNKRYFHNEKLTGVLTECFNSLREIKLFNMYKYFSKNFLFHKDVDGWSNVMNLFTRQLNIFLIELIVIIVFSTIIIYALKFNFDTNDLIITLGFYAICLIRLLPTVNKIADAYQAYKFNKMAVDKLHDDYQKELSKKLEDDFEITQEKVLKKINFVDKLKMKNVEFYYTKNSKFKINIEDFTIYKNEYLGIYGNSGSGKSTFIDLISGLTKPQSGIIYSDNLDIYENILSWRKKIGYVPQNIYLLDDTIRNNICMIDKIDNSLKDEKYFEEILEMCYLNDLFYDYKDNFIGEGGNRISGGQKQRIGIARALYKKPEILILDEPTSSLDVDTEMKFLSSLKNLKSKITIIFISHKVENFRDVDRTIRIVDGKIYEN